MHALSLEFSATRTLGLGDTAASLFVVRYSAREKNTCHEQGRRIRRKRGVQKKGHHIETYARITALTEETPKHENSYLT